MNNSFNRNIFIKTPFFTNYYLNLLSTLIISYLLINTISIYTKKIIESINNINDSIKIKKTFGSLKIKTKLFDQFLSTNTLLVLVPTIPELIIFFIFHINNNNSNNNNNSSNNSFSFNNNFSFNSDNEINSLIQVSAYNSFLIPALLILIINKEKKLINFNMYFYSIIFNCFSFIILDIFINHYNPNIINIFESILIIFVYLFYLIGGFYLKKLFPFLSNKKLFNNIDDNELIIIKEINIYHEFKLDEIKKYELDNILFLGKNILDLDIIIKEVIDIEHFKKNINFSNVFINDKNEISFIILENNNNINFKNYFFIKLLINSNKKYFKYEDQITNNIILQNIKINIINDAIKIDYNKLKLEKNKQIKIELDSNNNKIIFPLIKDNLNYNIELNKIYNTNLFVSSFNFELGTYYLDIFDRKIEIEVVESFDFKKDNLYIKQLENISNYYKFEDNRFIGSTSFFYKSLLICKFIFINLPLSLIKSLADILPDKYLLGGLPLFILSIIHVVFFKIFLIDTLHIFFYNIENKNLYEKTIIVIGSNISDLILSYNSLLLNNNADQAFLNGLGTNNFDILIGFSLFKLVNNIIDSNIINININNLNVNINVNVNKTNNETLLFNNKSFNIYLFILLLIISTFLLYIKLKKNNLNITNEFNTTKDKLFTLISFIILLLFFILIFICTIYIK